MGNVGELLNVFTPKPHLHSDTHTQDRNENFLLDGNVKTEGKKFTLKLTVHKTDM